MVQFFIVLTNQLQNRRCGIWCKAEMPHYPQLFSDKARVVLPLSETFCGREAGMPVMALPDRLNVYQNREEQLLSTDSAEFMNSIALSRSSTCLDAFHHGS
jgi:hypothetical protein